MPRTTNTDAKNHVAAPQFTGAHDAQEVSQQHAVELTRQGAQQQLGENIDIHSPAEVTAAAFMEQPVEVLVHPKQDTPIPGIVLNVNGEDCAIPFGRPVVIKRKFIQQLLDMRETRFTQPVRNHFQVEAGNQLIPKTSLLYPFAVSRDPHRGGMEWLQREQMRVNGFAAGLR